jgi:hypothetical protein
MSASFRWSKIFTKGWQLTGQNIVSFVALLAVQVGAFLLLAPTITSYSLEMDFAALEYGALPIFDGSSSAVDVVYLLLGVFLAMVTAAYFLSAARGRANLDGALVFERQTFWHFLWLYLLVCGAMVLWLGVNMLIFGTAAFAMIGAAMMQAPYFVSGSFTDLSGFIGIMSWPILGAVVVTLGVVVSALAWSFAPFLVLDGAGPFAALQKSWRMSYGYRWLTLFLNLLPVLAASLVVLFFVVLTALAGMVGWAWLTGFLAAISVTCAVLAFVLASGVQKFGLATLYTVITKK